MTEKNFMGRAEFRWFIGVVEDRNDPLALGRVRVRAYGLHTGERTKIPTEDLSWCHVLTPHAMSGIGSGPPLMVEGTTVYGYFLDEEMQEPVVWGGVTGISPTIPQASQGFSDPGEDIQTRPGIPASVTFAGDGSGVTIGNRQTTRYPSVTDEPDTPREARNEGEIRTQKLKADARAAGQTGISTASHSSAGGSDGSVAGGTFSEPESPYGAIYPYCHVTVSESGHAIEMDDTPDRERLSWLHRSGTFNEWHPNGDGVAKVVGDDYRLSMKARYEHVEADYALTVDKGYRVLVNADEGGSGYVLEIGAGGDLSVTVRSGNVNVNAEGGDGNVKVSNNVNADVGSDLTATVGGNVTVNVDGNANVTAGGNISMESGGNISMTAAGNIALSGTRIDLN